MPISPRVWCEVPTRVDRGGALVRRRSDRTGAIAHVCHRLNKSLGYSVRVAETRNGASRSFDKKKIKKNWWSGHNSNNAAATDWIIDIVPRFFRLSSVLELSVF